MNGEANIRARLANWFILVKPILITILIATALVFITFISSFTLKATVFSEEAAGEKAAVAGIANASIFLGIAIIGGFFIFLLFKYKKRHAIQYLFGGALSLSNSLIIFFFLSILIEDIRHYSTGYIPYVVFPGLHSIDPFFAVFSNDLALPVLIFAFFSGFLLCYTVLSRRFQKRRRNIALMTLGGMMGAFLAVIMPTWTVMFMLIGLSLYDIYSVKRGPIRNIMEMTEDERRQRVNRRALHKKKEQFIFYGLNRENIICPFCRSSNLKVGRHDVISCISCKNEGIISGASRTVQALIREYDSRNRPHRKKRQINGDETGFNCIITFLFDREMGSGRGLSRLNSRMNLKGMGPEDLMECLTYSARDWDLGIGDLVFYSMLVAHSFQFGVEYYDKIGIFAPVLMFILSTVGILAGFMVTLHFLAKNKILPGLPMSIFMGVAGFVLGALLLWAW